MPIFDRAETSISIHALRVEGDLVALHGEVRSIEFLSTPSGWRATKSALDSLGQLEQFLSTPSGWRATQAAQRPEALLLISIHALRVEGDVAARFSADGSVDISIHALRVEGDLLRSCR